MRRASIIILTLLLISITGISISGQQQIMIAPSDCNRCSLSEFLIQLENQYSIKAFYNTDSLPVITLEVKESIELEKLLNGHLKKHQLFASYIPEKYLFISKNPINPDFNFSYTKTENKKTENTDNNTNKSQNYLETKNQLTTKKIILGENNSSQKRQQITMNGYLRNAEDGEPIIGGTIYIEELETGTVTDANGYYTINLPTGTYTLTISSIGSKDERYELVAHTSERVDISLEQELISLEEVVVSAERHHNVRGTQMGFEKLSTKSIKEIPLVLGERDIIKVAQFLPGVQSVGEGTSGFNVRGSPTDQNIFYINHLPVYNTSHLFGFFSSFNSEAINEFSLHKSNIPVEFGGRLSSIFDVKTKKGNKNHFSARGGISPITGNLMVEGPIKKNESSYLMAIRSTYSDWLLSLVDDPTIRNSSARFRDGLANFDVALNDKNSISLFGYHSYDRVDLNGQFINRYSSSGGSFSWNHIIRNKHNIVTTFVKSKYGFTEKNYEIPIIAYNHRYAIDHTEIKSLLTLRPSNNHQINAGFSTILYNLNRGKHQPYGNESVVESRELGKEKGLETAFYISEQWDPFSFLTLYGGIRYNLFHYLGPQTSYSYLEGVLPSEETIVDTSDYSSNEIISTYQKPDVRIGAKILISNNLSLKLSYNQLYQSIYMLSNTIAVSPSAKWKLADQYTKPMEGSQYSAGIYFNPPNTNFELSLEAYRKEVKNQVEYRDGAELLANPNPEWDIQQGLLDAYGLELMVKKNYGRLTGWLNYTFSEATLDMSNTSRINAINFGEKYPANYDKPHAFNIVTNYRFNRRISISGNLVYSTGRPITYPTAIYFQNDSRIIQYSTRNEYRIPDYFRMDLAVSVEGNLLSKKLAHGSWMFSIYNLTGRRNPYSIYFKTEEGLVQGYKLSIFGRPIFTLTYNFKLGNYAS